MQLENIMPKVTVHNIINLLYAPNVFMVSNTNVAPGMNTRLFTKISVNNNEYNSKLVILCNKHKLVINTFDFIKQLYILVSEYIN